MSRRAIVRESATPRSYGPPVTLKEAGTIGARWLPRARSARRGRPSTPGVARGGRRQAGFLVERLAEQTLARACGGARLRRALAGAPAFRARSGRSIGSDGLQCGLRARRGAG